jgi:hypothetical protein
MLCGEVLHNDESEARAPRRPSQVVPVTLDSCACRQPCQPLLANKDLTALATSDIADGSWKPGRRPLEPGV